MNYRTILLMLLTVGLALNVSVEGRTRPLLQNEAPMTARGTFDVKVSPQPQDDSAGGPFGRVFLDKKFHGDLDAVSHGQMMSAETAVKGSAAYVALELVTGTLGGRRGSFILQHKGTMRHGAFELDLTVVPDSGTGELAGISGAMKILIKGSDHSYELAYSLSKPGQ